MEVIAYPATEFSDLSCQLSHPPKGDVRFGLSIPEQKLVVPAEQRFLDAAGRLKRSTDINAPLDKFRLAATLRDIGEFTIVRRRARYCAG